MEESRPQCYTVDRNIETKSDYSLFLIALNFLRCSQFPMSSFITNDVTRRRVKKRLLIVHSIPHQHGAVLSVITACSDGFSVITSFIG